MSCLPPKGTERRTLHVLGNRHTPEKRVRFKWTGRGWETPGTGFETVPTAMATLGWFYIEKAMCDGCQCHPPEGNSKLCTICSGWKRETDDLKAVNAHHVDERNHWKTRYERCAAMCKAAIAKLRAGFAEIEEAYLDTLTDEVGKREEMIRELHGQLSCLCAAIETHPFEQENDFVKQERERARKLLEHHDVSEMAKPKLRQGE